MYVVCSYDTPDDLRRVRFSKILEGFGDRVQRSVFEAILDAHQLEELKRRLGRVIEKEQDSIRIYSLCGACQRNVTIIGKGQKTEVDDVFIV